MPQNNPLPGVAPITDPNAGPSPAATSTNLAPADPARFQSKKSPSGLGALLGSIASAGSSGVGLLGGLLSSGLGMIGDAINYKRQNKLYDKQRADALADYDRQRSDYLSDLASERAYNSPAAQVARLKAAGINPNTVFGSGSVSNTSSDASNQAGFRGSAAPTPATSGLGSAFASGFTAASSGQIQSGMLDVQAQQAKANIELQRTEMLKLLSETKGIDENTKSRAIENGWLDFLFESEVNERYQRISESISRQNSMAISDAQEIFRLHNILPKDAAHLEAITNKAWRDIARINEEVRFLSDTHDYRVSSEKFKATSAEIQSVIDEFSKEVAAITVPSQQKNALMKYQIEQAHRMALYRNGIPGSISFGFSKK